MQYLILQIWALIAAAAFVGLLMGWAIGAGANGARMRDFRRRMRELEGEAASQRDEAARLAAELQRSGREGDPVTEIRRLEFQLREAQTAAARERDTAGELRAQLVALESRKSSGRRVDASEVEGLHARIRELETQLANTSSGDQELDRLRSRCAEIEGAAREAEALRSQTNSDLQLIEELKRNVEAANAERDALRSQNETDFEQEAELRAERDELQSRLDALAEGDEAAFSDQEEPNRAHWLVARNNWLERKLTELQGGEPAEPDASEQELIELRARVAELEKRPKPPPPEELASDDPSSEGEDADPAARVARLQWRIQYLSSRVEYLEGKQAQPAADSAELTRLRDRNEELERAAAVGAGAHGLYEELERLRQRLQEFERAEPVDLDDESADEGGEEGYTLAWRNRYLGARVRFLERRVREYEESGGAANGAAKAQEDDEADVEGGLPARIRAELAGLRSQAEQVPRLRARLAELEGGDGARAAVQEAERLRARVSELERQLGLARAGDGAARPSRNEGDYALEWRNRYLTSRVKYLEERLAETRRAPVSDGESAGETV